jgi:hypothetical protein
MLIEPQWIVLGGVAALTAMEGDTLVRRFLKE